MTMAKNNQYLLLNTVSRFPRGIRINRIMEKTGMTMAQVRVAAASLKHRITRYVSQDGIHGYRMAPSIVKPAGLPTPRECVPLHLMAVYTGETSMGRVSL